MRRSKIGGLLDHFVGERKQRWWNFEAERASGWQVDDKVELCRLHDRQIGGLFPFEDAPHIDSKLTVGVRYARAVAHEAPVLHIQAHGIDRGNGMARCQSDNLQAPVNQDRVGGDHECVDFVTGKRREGGLDFKAVARANDFQLDTDRGGRSYQLFGEGPRLSPHSGSPAHQRERQQEEARAAGPAAWLPTRR